jgi:hypothetical protein
MRGLSDYPVSIFGKPTVLRDPSFVGFADTFSRTVRRK